MKTFEIEITETLQVIQEVEANNYDEAYNIIKNKYKNEEIILTAEEHVDTEIKPYLYSSKYSIDIENSEFKNYILKKAEDTLVEMSVEELIELAFENIESAIESFKNSK